MTNPLTAPPRGREGLIIPAGRRGVTTLCSPVFLAILAGLALRLLFVYRFPGTAGDSEIYLQLARNWADHHVYGLWLNSQLVPADLRTPGYPAFLAGVALLLGRSTRAILLSQAVLDVFTCILTAVLAAALAPPRARRQVWNIALWLAVTCPFVANYAAVVLTETLVTLLATAALLCFVVALSNTGFSLWGLVLGGNDRKTGRLKPALLGGFLTGIATLVRPEMPLLLAVAALVFLWRAWKVRDFRKAVLSVAGMTGAFLLPVLPWAVRNAVTLKEVQFLAPRYATLPGEYAPVGYFSWTKTWLERYRDVYLAIWKIGEEPIEVGDLPASAFDTPEEKAHVCDLIEQYNNDPNLDIGPELDRQFAEVARQRTRRHPFRTYVSVPFQRALSIWFTPRTELLPIDGKFWPLRDQWEDSPANVLITGALALLGYLYAALALWGAWWACVLRRGAWRARQGTGTEDPASGTNLWGIALLLAYLLIRTAFLTTIETPEPRYVVSCYPAVLALVALLGVRNNGQETAP